jgi:hypothetical protein
MACFSNVASPFIVRLIGRITAALSSSAGPKDGVVDKRW